MSTDDERKGPGSHQRRTVHVVQVPDGSPTQVPPAQSGGDDMLSVLRDIRDELRHTRAEAEASTRRLQEALTTEMEWSRKLLRTLVNEQYKAREDEVIAAIGPLQYDFAQTLDVVHSERLSLARYGDGELLMMADPDHRLRFQKNSAELRRDLFATLSPQGAAKDRVLVALPHLFRGDLHWFRVWISVWDMLRPLLNPDQRYGDAHVSRPNFFRAEGAAGIEQWRRVWADREVLVVTGRGSRFDAIPALFDCAKRIDTLHTVASNAYEERDRILESISTRARPDTLVLLSLGPAATVLAPQIAGMGFQALDIGHISASYLNVHGNGVRPELMSHTGNPQGDG